MKHKNIFITLLLILLVSFFGFNNVHAENIKFNEKKFERYFEKKKFEVSNMSCKDFELTKNLKCTLYIAKKGNAEVNMYKFDDEADAYDHFHWVIDENKPIFTKMKTYNLDETEKSNYSTIKTVLSDYLYFYMVKVDNYVIKSNIDITEDYKMNYIYDDLGFIKIKKHVSFWIILIILLVVALIYVISKDIIRKQDMKKAN